MKIAICDDELTFVNYFSEIITNYFKENGLDCDILQFNDPKELVEYYKSNSNIDVLVLDIEMPTYSGIEVAKDIREFDKNVTIMFLSSNNTCGDSACDLKVFKYIYKVQGKEKIYSAFDDLIKEQKYNEITYTISASLAEFKTYIKNIVYIKMKDHYAEFHLVNKIVSERNSLNNIINDIRFERFILINRSALVNYAFIKDINGVILLTTGETLKYSKIKKFDILKKYLYLKEE